MDDVEGIIKIHDLHIWSITSGQNALSCHAVVDDDLFVQECQKLLRTIEQELKNKSIGHVTVQLENDEHLHENSLMCQNSGESHDF